MCGVGTVISKDNVLNVNELNDILSRIAHRGRAGTCNETLELIKYGMCIGTNRLPIVNPERNKQPAVSRSSNLVLVMNAEIFNFKELAKEYSMNYILELEYGDTYFLVEFIEKYGIELVLKRINWEGCFIYLDKRTNELIFARDHLGIKPLYYALTKDNMFMSSEIKGLVQFECDEIKEVLPGTVNVFSLEHRNIDTKSWYSIDDSLMDDNLSDVLRDAVEIRVPDEHYAILLSGGLDSSIVLSLAHKVHKNITAYTLYTENSPDLPYARKLCKELNIQLVEVHGEDSTILKNKIPKIVDIVETWQWQVINHSAPMDILFRKIQEDGHKVVLTGEGADELFFGYEETYCYGQHSEKEQERRSRILDLHKTNCRRLDRMSMAYGLECRVPFLDKRIVALSLKYSYDDCVSVVNNKLPLRKIGESILPPNFSNRAKLSLSKGAGYVYGKDQKAKNIFDFDNSNSYVMKNKEYELIAKYPIEKYLLDLASEKGYLRAKYLLVAGI